MRPVRFAVVLALALLGACTEEASPPSPPPDDEQPGEEKPPEQVPPVSSAAPFQPCGAIGAGALAASALSPDGSVLAVATLSGQLVLYRTADGSRLQTLWELPGQQVNVVFSEDGRRLVAANQTQTRIWSYPDLTPVRTFDLPHSHRTTALALSPDGALLATGGFDTAGNETASIRIWSVEDGSLRGSLQRSYEQVVQSLAFSPDGASLAISTHHFVFIVSAADASEQRAVPGLSGGQLGWSKDGSLLASGGRVVRLDTGALVKDLELSTTRDASAFSPDGLLYADALGSEVTVYRVADWSKVHTFPEPNASYVSRLSFSQDSTGLVVDLGVSAFWCNGVGQLCGPWGNEVRIHPVQDLATVRTVSLGPVMRDHVVFSPDGSLLASTGDGVMGIWRTRGQHQVATSNIQSPSRLQFSSDQRQLRANNAIYDTATGKGLREFQGQALSPDFKTSAGREDDRILLRDVITNKALQTFELNAYVIGFSPDGRFLATTAYDGRTRIQLLDVAGGTVRHAFELDYNQGGSRLDFSPDGRWVTLTSPYDGFASTEVRGLGTASSRSLPPSFTAVFSPDSTVLATGGVDPEVRILTTTDFSLRERLVGHGTYLGQEQWPRGIVGAAFARTGQLATLGADRTIRFWCSN
ncbi:WD40 repeat domain-containing protein [Corallococcus sp. AB045]|uniref:WD40 repeat domain-containing protein n=1 Tax=Corallococcus sp. AB045 TaxID=2316719 RepID=UPI000ED713FB|nr:WD40 repeat domain-containing protein [Corallococcus sp. AB045]RKH87727.1 WD40 repeat domain-containing protein [Corallococcus sp. AB045]